MKRIIIKLGTNILTNTEGKLDLAHLSALVEQMASIQTKKPQLELLLVSSGAITCGAEILGITAESIPEKQAAAAVGQVQLMHAYADQFIKHDIKISQVLLTKDGLSHASAKENISNTIFTLLNKDCLPIFNENDCVATDEIGERFGDNDELSGLIASLIQADKLIILTDTDGLYTQNPNEDRDAKFIPEVLNIDDSILNLASDKRSTRNRGGMRAKLETAKLCNKAGIDVIIANGRRPNVLQEILDQKASVGTLFKACNRSN
eukprot:COSAG01_NODE_1_length_100484_cov_170.446142_107_plen_263_part_00